MSVLIKNMEMPKSCYECNLKIICDYASMNGWISNKRDSMCPLVEVPPHGRLIDADALHDAIYHRAFETDGDTMWQSGCWVRYRAIE